MKRNWIGIVVLAVVILASWGLMEGVAAWRSAAWTYQSADLYGTDCIQSAIDEFDTRLDYLGATHASTPAINGEIITDDTIDDDSLDFVDITGADLTLTDCGVVGASDLRDSSLAPATVTTNGQAIALNGAGMIVQLNASVGTNNATNTITLTTLGTGTNGVFFIMNTGTSNNLAIAKSGTRKSAAVEIGESEGLLVIGNAGSFYGVE